MFTFEAKQFEIQYGKVGMNVERMDIPNRTAFRVIFSSQRLPLVVAIAKGVNEPWFWTSIPEGRQKEAEGVGKLIEAHFKAME